MPVVDIPSIGRVEFPDTMSVDDIQRSAAALHRSTTYEGQLSDLGLTQSQVDTASAAANKKADLAAGMKEARKSGEYWEGFAKRAQDVSDATLPGAVTPENPLGVAGSVGKLVGQGVNAAGDVARGVMRDINAGTTQDLPNTRAALGGTDIEIGRAHV